jgi:hypothetical protein
MSRSPFVVGRECRKPSWKDEVAEAVGSVLQEDLMGEENSEQVKEPIRQLVAEDFEL